MSVVLMSNNTEFRLNKKHLTVALIAIGMVAAFMIPYQALQAVPSGSNLVNKAYVLPSSAPDFRFVDVTPFNNLIKITTPYLIQVTFEPIYHRLGIQELGKP